MKSEHQNTCPHCRPKEPMMDDAEMRLLIHESRGYDCKFAREALEIFRERDGYPDAIFTLAGIPDYLNDLSAMHEAEKTLKGSKDDEHSELSGYQEHLCLVCGDGTDPLNVYEIDLILASARQKAEAFLRTVGKWRIE